MSLNFDVTNVKDYANVTTSPHPHPFEGKESWHPVTDAIVWATIPCGIWEITEENIDMVWQRISRWQEVLGAFFHGKDGDLFLQKEDVVMHIGLTTNASAKTDAEFVATLLRQMDTNAHRRSKARGAMDTMGWKGRPGNKEPRE